MTEELARRAVACKRWRWVPGMVAIWRHPQDKEAGRYRVAASGPGGCAHGVGAFRVNADGGAGDMRTFPDALPDLTDPATLGCLLALVREAWGDPKVCALVMDSGRWCVSGDVRRSPPPYWQWGDTEAEALVAALEAAPAKGVAR